MGKLVSIKINKDVKPLYDIEVQDNHNFVVNDGIVIKNSEQYLSPESLCVLGSINVGKFSTDPSQYEHELSIIGFSINRFLDNVNEMEVRMGTYATPYQKMAIESLRRTGAGVTDIGGWLFKKNLEYGTSEGNEAINHFMERYNYYLYKSSIELGREKGSFGLFDRDKYEKSPFIQRMMSLGLVFDAMRNVTCSSIAPTGTLSLQFRNLVFSYGIEPGFGLYYWKRTRISGKYEYYFCVPSVVRQVLKENGIDLPMDSDAVRDTWDGAKGRPVAGIIEKARKELGLKFKNATEVSPFDKLELMSGVMKWCDSSISVTYMLPEGTDWKDVYDFILMAHKKGVKSIAAFPDRKMYGIVSMLSFRDLAVKLRKEGVDIHPQNFSGNEPETLQMLTNTVVEGNDRIIKTQAPKRPTSLNCDIHHIKFTKRLDKPRTFEYVVVVGLLHGTPYEVFVAESYELTKKQMKEKKITTSIMSEDGKTIKDVEETVADEVGPIKKYTKGVLTREKRGVYSVNFDDGSCIKDITGSTTEQEDMFTRMVSMSLRHGADISYVVEQLEKTETDPELKMWSFSSAMARALKKYIKDGTKVNGQTCKSCGSTNLVRNEGCVTCQDCQSSKCS